MNETRAVVIKTENAVAYVEAQNKGGCSSCSTSGGCSTAMLGRIFSQKPRMFKALNPIEAKAGDEVVVGVEDGALLRGALSVYVLPLLLLLGGALLAALLAPSASARDGYSVAGAALGLAASVIWLKVFSGRYGASRAFQPVILRRT